MSTDQQQVNLTREEKDFIQERIDKVNELEALIQEGSVNKNSAIQKIDQLLDEVAQITDQALERPAEVQKELDITELPRVTVSQASSNDQHQLVKLTKQKAIEKSLQSPTETPAAVSNNDELKQNYAWEKIFKEEDSPKQPYSPMQRAPKKKLKTSSKRKVTRNKRKPKKKSPFLKLCFALIILACMSFFAYPGLLTNLQKPNKKTNSEQAPNQAGANRAAVNKATARKKTSSFSEPMITELKQLEDRLAESGLKKSEKNKLNRLKSELEELLAIRKSMSPYRGFKNSKIDNQGLHGKIMCGYQGWFTAKGDGSGSDWTHYKAGKELKPGSITIDLWPDMSEMDKDEKYPTPFKHADGSTAYLFSSYNGKTVDRHFGWMKDYKINGVFLQRFGVNLKRPDLYKRRNVITHHVQSAANKHGRTWAMMYDLTGFKAGDIKKHLIPDWVALKDKVKITEDPSYLHHKGKPVISVWGIGFDDDRKYSLKETEELIDFLKNDPVYGGNTVIVGTPSFWREETRDALKNSRLHEVLAKADIISPWTPGRYRTPKQATEHAQQVIKPDVKWCAERNLEHYPVIFPGFSWQNLMRTKGQDAKLNHIPRLKGQFMWTQASEYKKAGAKMLYVAMFDEVDEATAIMKCTNNPPVGKSNFIDYEGLPSDHYLKLCGEIRKMLNSKSTPPLKIPSPLKP